MKQVSISNINIIGPIFIKTEVYEIQNHSRTNSKTISKLGRIKRMNRTLRSKSNSVNSFISKARKNDEILSFKIKSHEI